jgi:hypothetical protein
MTGFLDEGQFRNPFEALEAIGGPLAQDGASAEDLISAAESVSYAAESTKDIRNLKAFADQFVENPHYIRKPDLADIDNRVADRMTIKSALGATAAANLFDGTLDFSEAARVAAADFRPTPELVTVREEIMSEMLEGRNNERALTADARMEELDRAVLDAFRQRGIELEAERQARQEQQKDQGES